MITLDDLTDREREAVARYVSLGSTEEEAYAKMRDMQQFLNEHGRECRADKKKLRRKENWEIFRAIPRFLMGFGMYSSDPQIARDSMVYMATCAAEDHAKAQQEQVDAIREQTAQQARVAAMQAQTEEERMLRMARAMAQEMFAEAERRKAA